MSKHFHVTIFGSSRITRNNKIYKEVYDLAKLIGEKDLDVVTGGCPGIMEAASLGHKEGSKNNNSHAIGLGIKLPHEQVFNKGVDLYERFDRFSSRLDNFMLLSNVVVVAEGGIGTLLELFYTWQLAQTKKVTHIPIILFGEEWKGLLTWLKESPLRKKYFTEGDLNLIHFAKNSQDAMKIIEKTYNLHKKEKIVLT